MSDYKFIEWFKNKNMLMIEQVAKEYQAEYYCRLAYFSRDEEIEKLEVDNLRLKKCLEYISKTDITSDVDSLWLNSWRNKTSEVFSKYVKRKVKK